MADEQPEQNEEQAPQTLEQAASTSEAGADEAGPEEMSPDELDEARANEVAFSWQASEYVHHHKGPGWYAALLGGVVVMVGLAALLHFWLEIGMFLAAGGAVMVYAKKAPRTLMYELTPKGVVIEGKERPFTEFRSFGVVKDDEWHTIDLEPLKRLAPRLAILFDSNDFDNIVGHLELHLPRADRDPDPIEKLSRYLRF